MSRQPLIQVTGRGIDRMFPVVRSAVAWAQGIVVGTDQTLYVRDQTGRIVFQVNQSGTWPVGRSDS